jgi:hypothetical protein
MHVTELATAQFHSSIFGIFLLFTVKMRTGLYLWSTRLGRGEGGTRRGDGSWVLSLVATVM